MPWGSAAMLKMWLACPYSLWTSGQRVFCARCSSRGGPATADGVGLGARSGPYIHIMLLQFQPSSVLLSAAAPLFRETHRCLDTGAAEITSV